MAEPMGVVAAMIPCTNPTSTAIFKALIALKGRNTIVMSPHPSAVRCIQESARVLSEAAGWRLRQNSSDSVHANNLTLLAAQRSIVLAASLKLPAKHKHHPQQRKEITST